MEPIAPSTYVIACDIWGRVRQQFFPDDSPFDTGLRWLGGRTVLDRSLRNLLAEATSECAVSISDGGTQWFLASVYFQQRPHEAARALWPGLQYTDNDDFLMWALIGHRDHFIFADEQLFGAASEELYRFALGAVGGGHPMLKQFVEAAAPDRSFALAIRALPVVDPWRSAPITFVGDAIHAGAVNGTGANSALEDAALLCKHILGSQTDLQLALDEYETELLRRVRAMRAGQAEARSTIMRTMGAAGWSGNAMPY
jgi:2-polyprenyl-6-methoxyphenol hydroxylase-like FAD-dependent oxidoreductase